MLVERIINNHDPLANALGAVVTVGHGRGFVVEGINFIGGLERYVITAAHCLPKSKGGQRLPPPHGSSYTEERTYKKLLAPLGKKPSVWCECLFVDPIADIAVLGTPDNQALFDEANAYEALVETTTALRVAEPPSHPIPQERSNKPIRTRTKKGTAPPTYVDIVPSDKRARRQCPAFLLSLTNQWFECTLEHHPNGMLNVVDAAQGIAGGMSGSPIIAENGTAIGIVCLGSESPNPRLMGNLPGWFLKELSGAR